MLKRVRPTPYNVHTRIYFSTNVKEFYEGSLEHLSRQLKIMHMNPSLSPL